MDLLLESTTSFRTVEDEVEMSTSFPVMTTQLEDSVELGTNIPLSTSSPEQDGHILSLPEVSDDYLDGPDAKQSKMRLSNSHAPSDDIRGEIQFLLKTLSGEESEVKSRSRDVSKANRSTRNKTRTRTSLPTKSASGVPAFPTALHSTGRPQAEVLRTPAKETDVSITKEDTKTNNHEVKQGVVLDPMLVGNVLQRELARLNLNVLRNMARMLDEQEQKFTAERNTLRASGRMLRAEMRKALSETIKINSERRKLDLERDVLQSQLLNRRRSARLLDLMIQDYEHGRERTPSDINGLYMYSRLLGSSPAGRDLGEQLEYETNMLDQRRLYLQSLLVPRWQRPPEAFGSIVQDYPLQVTATNSPKFPSLHVGTGRTHLSEEMPGWSREWPGLSRVSPGVILQQEDLQNEK